VSKERIGSEFVEMLSTAHFDRCMQLLVESGLYVFYFNVRYGCSPVDCAVGCVKMRLCVCVYGWVWVTRGVLYLCVCMCVCCR
jgi:Probable RNA and SrmB- binding site of polymerase A